MFHAWPPLIEESMVLAESQLEKRKELPTRIRSLTYRLFDGRATSRARGGSMSIPARRLLLPWLGAAIFLVPVTHAQESSLDIRHQASDLFLAACDSEASPEFRAFKQRQIHRRQADLEKTLTALRADALSNADAYTAEDREDLAATIARLLAEQDEARAF